MYFNNVTIFKIYNYLNINDLFNCSLINKQFNNIFNCDLLWENITDIQKQLNVLLLNFH